MEMKGNWCAYTIEDYNKTIRFKTKDGIRGCDPNITIRDGRCYMENGKEIEVLSMEHLVTMPETKMTNTEQMESIIKNFNECQTFEQQIKHLSLNHHILELYLDNDGEYINFVDEELSELADEMYDYSNPFNNMKLDDYIGNSEGAFKLLEILGVNVQYV